MQDLYIVNYRNPSCAPLQSITRLPEAEAFALAKMLSANHQGTAFGRFADFVHYYPKRIRTERWLYEHFLALGGEPATEHPLYFVLQGSEYLNGWFDNGSVTKLPLAAIDAKHVSFTLGDSMSKMDKPERRDPFLKDSLFERIGHSGGVDRFLREIKAQYNYVEVQLWQDAYCAEYTNSR